MGVRLEVDRFLTELTRLYEKSKDGGKSVTLTMKRSNLANKRASKRKASKAAADKDGEGYVCLVRAVVRRLPCESSAFANKASPYAATHVRLGFCPHPPPPPHTHTHTHTHTNANHLEHV